MASVSCKSVKPLLSTNMCEARRRVLRLYRDSHRVIPELVRRFDIPKSEADFYKKLRELFYKNRCVSDIRVIDLLVIKGYMELKEMTENWQQKGRVFSLWSPTLEKKPTTFLGKFLENMD